MLLLLRNTVKVSAFEIKKIKEQFKTLPHPESTVCSCFMSAIFEELYKSSVCNVTKM
jgi:hypothetical protein